jgi:hypothetical protein
VETFTWLCRVFSEQTEAHPKDACALPRSFSAFKR